PGGHHAPQPPVRNPGKDDESCREFTRGTEPHTSWQLSARRSNNRSSAVWASKTGSIAHDNAMAAVANNLADVSTTGCKSHRVAIDDLFYAIERQPGAQADQINAVPSGIQLGSGVRVAGTQKVFTEGNIQTTGQPMDLAIIGSGFFQVEAPSG